MNSHTITTLRRFFSKFPSRKVSKGTIIYRPGDKIDDVSFIKSGYVRLFTKNKLQETTLFLFRPLFVISYTHSISKHPLNFYVEALTNCEIWNISTKTFQEYLEKDNSISKKLSTYLLSSFIQIMSNQASLINGNSLSKVATLLLQIGTEYGTIKGNQIDVPFPATHRVIGTLIGLTRETTSVQMSFLQKKKIILTKRNEYTILNFDELKKISQT